MALMSEAPSNLLDSASEQPDQSRILDGKNTTLVDSIQPQEVSYILRNQYIAGLLSLGEKTISWSPTSVTASNSFVIPLEMVFSVLFTNSDSNFKSLLNCHKSLSVNSSSQFTLFGYDKNRGVTINSWTFSCSTASEAKSLVEKIQAFLQPPGTRKGASRNLLLLLNPASGTKKALSIYENIVKPMLEMAHVDHTLKQTEKALHAREIGETFDYSLYDAVATISGDGLLHEFLNGMLTRKDREEARKTPIGIIPAGSGNALAKSVDTVTPELAVLNLIAGSTRPFDIMTMRLADDSIRYSFLMATWGYIADVDIESEKLRWAGPARLTIYAFIRLLNLRSYQGRIHYIPFDAPVDEANNSLKVESNFEFAYVNEVSVPVTQKLEEPWVTRDCSFSQFFALNIPWISAEFLACKHSRLNNGYIDLIWIEKVPGSKFLQVMLDQDEGQYINRDFVNHIKARAIILEPMGRKSKSNPNEIRQGVLDIDGEVVLSGPIRIESHPGLCQLVTPSWLDEDKNTFSSSEACSVASNSSKSK